MKKSLIWVAVFLMLSANVFAGDLTVNGNISAGGNVAATGAVTGANVAVTGAVTGANVTATGDVTGANITATGAVTGNNIWMKIAEVDLAGLGSGGYTITGLNGNSQKMYKIYFQGTMAANGGNRKLYLRPNNSNSNYRGFAYFTGDVGGSDWDTTGFIIGQNYYNSDASVFVELSLSAISGAERFCSGRGIYYHPSNNAIVAYDRINMAWRDTSTNITSLWFGPTGGSLTGKLMVFALQ